MNFLIEERPTIEPEILCFSLELGAPFGAECVMLGVCRPPLGSRRPPAKPAVQTRAVMRLVEERSLAHGQRVPHDQRGGNHEVGDRRCGAAQEFGRGRGTATRVGTNECGLEKINARVEFVSAAHLLLNDGAVYNFYC